MEDIFDIKRRVSTDMEKISDQKIKLALRRFLIEPEKHGRIWEYGEGQELTCWWVAKFNHLKRGVIFAKEGHTDHWGVVSFSSKEFGPDAAWYLTLEEAFIESGAWNGDRPPGFQLQ
jgi:hypothetical protein